MFRKLFLILIKGRIEVNPMDMCLSSMILLIISMLFDHTGLFAMTLRCFSLITLWICIAWMWANNIWIGRYCFLKNDKDKEASGQEAREWARRYQSNKE